MKSKLFIGALLSTFLLVFLGDGVVANLVLGIKPADWNTIAFGWGFAVVFAGFIGNGANNPAIMIAMGMRNKDNAGDTIATIIGSMLGGFVGAAAVFVCYRDGLVAAGLPNVWTSGAGGFDGGSFSILTASITEFFATMILMWAVLAVGDKRNASVAHAGTFIVGAVVLVIGLCLGGPSGYSMNPARDLPPRIFGALIGTQGLFDGWYWLIPPVLVPIVSCIVACPLYDMFFASKD